MAGMLVVFDGRFDGLLDLRIDEEGRKFADFDKQKAVAKNVREEAGVTRPGTKDGAKEKVA